MAAVILYLGVGAAWTILNLRDVPHYGDTVIYFRNARELQAERFRGIVYPWVLAAADLVCVRGELPERLDWKPEEAGHGALPCTVPSGLACVQILQIGINLLCLIYFLRVVAGAPARSRRELWLLAALLALDPLVGHFNLALMADSLALSGMLVFCASLSALVLQRGSPWTAAVLLFTSYIAVSGLRIEKRSVLFATLLLSLVGWAWMNRRGLLSLPRTVGVRSVMAALLAGVGLLLTAAVHEAVSVPEPGWSGRETVTHFRLIFPYLHEVYDELPLSARERITRGDARLYDTHVNYVRVAIDRATGGDAQLRSELTRELLATVLPRRWGSIALDVARDAAENAFATLSFYTRIVVWRVLGHAAIERWFRSDAAVWNYQRLVFHHPRLSAVHLGLFGVVAVLAIPLAHRRMPPKTPRAAWRERLGEHAAWLPAGVLWILNAAAFAVVVNITNIRYMVFSHALFLMLLYGAALRSRTPSRDKP